MLTYEPKNRIWVLLRGYSGFGNEPVMREAGRHGMPYLFKLRLTSNVKRMIERFSYQNKWMDTGRGWQTKESTLQLTCWSRQRRVIILRRRVKGDLAVSPNKNNGQKTLSFVEIGPNTEVYEYSVLVTSLDEERLPFKKSRWMSTRLAEAPNWLLATIHGGSKPNAI